MWRTVNLLFISSSTVAAVALGASYTLRDEWARRFRWR